jgi:hypothetical protein
MVASDCSAAALGVSRRGAVNRGAVTSSCLQTDDRYGFDGPPHCCAASAIAASPTCARSHARLEELVEYAIAGYNGKRTHCRVAGRRGDTFISAVQASVSLCLLGDLERVVDLDAKLPDRRTRTWA